MLRHCTLPLGALQVRRNVWFLQMLDEPHVLVTLGPSVRRDRSQHLGPRAQTEHPVPAKNVRPSVDVRPRSSDIIVLQKIVYAAGTAAAQPGGGVEHQHFFTRALLPEPCARQQTVTVVYA